MPHQRLQIFAFLLSLGLAAGPLGATSYVRVSDESLVAQAARIAVVRIETASGGQYTARVERALKGGGENEVLSLRIPGGISEGLTLRIHGAPVFGAGERALLFLEPTGEASWRPLHLFLGAFHEVESGGRRLAVRDLSEVSEVRVSSDGSLKALPPEPDRARDFDAFTRWVSARAAGQPKTADYFAPPGPGPPKFTVSVHLDDGKPLRWFDFDQGGTVDWRASSAGQEGFTGGGYSEVKAAFKAWNDDPLTAVDYRFVGTTDSTAGLDRFDEVNSIVFNDPAGFVPAFDCTAGGVLAIGGPWYQTSLTFQGRKPFHRIVKADIVVNSGIGCFFNRSASAGQLLAEILAHEVGHTLGLAHACGDALSPACASNPGFDQALMRAYVHDDGRGARLEADDVAGLRALYGSDLPPPLAPRRLAAHVLSPTAVELSWLDRATDETEYRVELRTVDGEFEEVGTVRAGSAAAFVQGLTPATGYVFRVRAGRLGIFSPYSNEAHVATDAVPGPCISDVSGVCLGGRFSARVAWKGPDGLPHPGTVMPTASGGSGLFWFSSPESLELLVRVTDGCPVNGRFWVYTGPATSLGFVLTVTDTETGKVRVYANPAGTPAQAVADLGAFGGCP